MMLTNQRRDKVNYYLDLAQTVAENSTCIHKHCGVVLVSADDIVVTTGYTGAPRGRQNCIDMGYCAKECVGRCRGVHAEANAVISANRREATGGSLYVVRMMVKEDGSTDGYVEDLECCESCKMLLINSGLRDVYVRVTENTYVRQTVMDWVNNDETLVPNANLHN